MESRLGIRQKIILIFLCSDNNAALDPIRIMKGLFVFAMETPPEWLPEGSFYEFVPYYYGPYSPQIYSDLAYLETRGYLRSIENPGRSWKSYSLTNEGVEIAQSIAHSLDPRITEYLKQIRDFVTRVSFRQLLATVYKKYPEYATKSVFQF
jgi:uncharacterized protein YwgA